MTSVPEIARRLIDGVWQTGVADDGGGGSQPGANITVGPVPFTFADAPSDAFGSAIWTPPANALLLDILLAVDTAWDAGEAPVVTFYNSATGDSFGAAMPLAPAYFVDGSDGSVTVASVALTVAAIGTPSVGSELPRLLPASPQGIVLRGGDTIEAAAGAARAWFIYSLPVAP